MTKVNKNPQHKEDEPDLGRSVDLEQIENSSTEKKLPEFDVNGTALNDI